MATFDLTQFTALINDVATAEDAVTAAGTAQTTAQAAADVADAALSQATSANAAAHADLGAKIDALVAYAQSLRV